MDGWPSVTEVIYASGVAGGSEFFKPKHLRRGRLCHDACHMIARGLEIPDGWWRMSSGNPDRPEDYLPHDEVREYVDGYSRWFNTVKWELADFEFEVINRAARYIGHIDQCGRFQGSDDWWLIDIKNGNPEPWHRLQTAAYKTALCVQEKIIARRACLYLPEGKFVEYKDPRDQNAFLSLVAAHHVINQYGGK